MGRGRVTGIRFSARGMFHGKRDSKGYHSADFFCETFFAIASDKVKKVIKGYGESGILITFYNPFNPVAHLYCSMLEIVSSRMITFMLMVSCETCF